MVNSLIDSEKLNYAALVYNPVNINQIMHLEPLITIADYIFLEVLEATCNASNINQLINKKIHR